MGFWEDKRVLVTGSTGFVGSWVRYKLEEKGAKVTPGKDWARYDLRDLGEGHYLFQYSPHIVINCAAHQGGLGYQKIKPATLCYDNVLMSMNTLRAAQRCGVEKYVNLIAGCAYPGEPAYGPLKEDALLDGPLHPSVENYGIAKRVAYIYAKCLREQYGFNAISLILINLYGPREHFEPDRSHALAALSRKFYEAKRDNLPTVTVWGTGKPKREWLYIEDAVEGILRATEIYNEPSPLNICTGKGYTIEQLARLIKDVVGYEGDIVYDTSKPDGAMEKIGSVARMWKWLDYTPGTSLEAGIRKTLDWLDKNYGLL